MKQKLLLLVALLCSAFSPLSSSAATAPVGERLPIPADGKSAVYFAHLYNKNKGYLYETTNGTLAFGNSVPNKKWRIDYNAENQTVTLSLGEKSIYMYYDSNYNPLNIFSKPEDAVNYGGTGTQGSRELRVTYTKKDANRGYDYIIYLWNQTTETGLLLEQNTELAIQGIFMTTRQQMGTILTDESSYVPGRASARWRFVNVEGGTDQANMTISATAKYGTFVAPFDVTLPEGITAFKVTGYDGSTQELELEDAAPNRKLAANTAVIVYGANLSSTFSQDFYGNAAGDQNANSGDYLVGTYEITPAPVGSFLLQYRTEPQEEAIFLYVDGSVEGLNCGKNRAYLTNIDTDPSAGIKSFKLSGIETAIEVVKADSNSQADDAIYDLSGRRLSQTPARGLYIQNGKKILVK